jgi:protein-L-isoaspartate(D-aspartate) O-methyltransferase
MRAVPRHVFLPHVPLRRAYANDVVQTKRGTDGVPISAASQPSIVGLMLEQLDVVPGARILEIGAGTGYNAALLAHLAGANGQVVTLDVDSDIVARARSALAAAARSNAAPSNAAGPNATGSNATAANVIVLRRDGALGAPEFAPFDRIIATVGVHDLPAAWPEQLAPGGLIVAPLRLRGSVTRSIAFRRAARAPETGTPETGASLETCVFSETDAFSETSASLETETPPETGASPGTAGAPPEAAAELRSISSEMCGFMPLRASIASDPRWIIPLTPSGDVILEVQQEQDADPELLAGVLQTPRAEAWTGVRTGLAPVEWLYLWLTCALPGGLFGLSAHPSAAERELMTPMFRWGTMAAVDRDSLAYLAFHPDVAGDAIAAADNPGDGTGIGTGDDVPREIGVVGHGPRGPELAEAVADQIRAWDRGYRDRTAEFTIRPGSRSEPANPQPGEFVLRTPGNVIIASWIDHLQHHPPQLPRPPPIPGRWMAHPYAYSRTYGPSIRRRVGGGAPDGGRVGLLTVGGGDA